MSGINRERGSLRLASLLVLDLSPDGSGGFDSEVLDRHNVEKDPAERPGGGTG